MAYQSKHTGVTIDDAIDQVAQLLDIFYPVGSIYTSTKSTSPATLFGGTWVQIKDTFLLTAGDTYSAGSQGGSATHTHTTAGHVLTVNEMPKHSHTVSSRMKSDGTNNGSTFNISNWGSPASGNSHYILQTSGVAASLSSGQYVGALNTGGSASHSHGDTGFSSNLPPYKVVYAWERTA